jgi:two-component system sensor histidine kinase UhpB
MTTIYTNIRHEMSLRARLNLLITLLFILYMLGTGVYVVNNAKFGIYNRVSTSANLAMQLIESTFISGDISTQAEQRLLVQLSGLEITEHLKISILQATDTLMQSPESMPLSVADAPPWFVRLVQPDTIEFRSVISWPGLPYAEIVVWSDPADEITDAWRETRDAMFFLVTFAIAINMLVFFTLGKGLAPLENIHKALKGIEQGEYNLRLPEFSLPELDRISKRFNHMADVLKDSREENRDLTRRSLIIQEQERRNLARELHDELGQTVSGIKAMGMSIIERATSSDPLILESASAIISNADRMYEVTKNMIHTLRPVVLDELGLIPALQEMIDGWNDRHENIFCYFNSDLKDIKLDDTVAINVYRIVQEGLTNIARHSQATEVKANLFMHGNKLVLSISDNGVGFSPEARFSKGIGLAGMKERVESMKGILEFISAPGRGVSFTISIPLQPVL